MRSPGYECWNECRYPGGSGRVKILLILSRETFSAGRSHGLRGHMTGTDLKVQPVLDRGANDSDSARGIKLGVDRPPQLNRASVGWLAWRARARRPKRNADRAHRLCLHDFAGGLQCLRTSLSSFF